MHELGWSVGPAAICHAVSLMMNGIAGVAQQKVTFYSHTHVEGHPTD